MNSLGVQRFLRFFSITTGTTIILGILYFTLPYTYPFIIGYIFAASINPLVNLLIRKTKMPRSLAVIIAMFSVFAVVAGLLTVLVFQIIAGVGFLASILPGYSKDISASVVDFFNVKIIPFFEKMTDLYNSFGTAPQTSIIDSLTSLSKNATDWLVNLLKSIIENIPLLVTWLPGATLSILFAMLATFFISKEWDSLAKTYYKMLPVNFVEPFNNVSTEVKRAVIGFFRAQVVLSIITAIIGSIGFSIIGIRYPIPIALLVSIGELIPYIGISSIFIPWILVNFLLGDSVTGVSLIIMFFIISMQRVIIEPKILSQNIGLDPLATLFIMFVGFKFMGIVGILLGIIVLVIITTLVKCNVFSDIKNYIVKGDRQK